MRGREDDDNHTMSANESIPCLAHPSDRLLIQLNREWRVIDDDLQYILQRKKGAGSIQSDRLGRTLLLSTAQISSANHLGAFRRIR